ncbi:hypothetical protein TH61_06150 [Rufibacter sp. DG15C]|uniref:hypothetical protein n=1 Tax=Rufibacter sp. DG15C TaxID=1379909 RepID=UPI00078C6D63|nr:hypothetical protein [Rufibacter sp. DG15C]AMM50846.1 hypothetical protein TH61_06150 [Rufibacter sp. DG15C]
MEPVIAYIKYEGELVKDGYLDAKKTAGVLSGLDGALRYFLYKENSDLEKIDFELPVSIRKGSWEAFFPENFNELLIKGLIAFSAKKYLESALGEMAKNDFKEIGFKDIFQRAFKAMTWVIKAAVHLGSLSKKSLDGFIFSPDNQFIGLKNAQGEIIWFPVEFLEQYADCPEGLFKNLIKIVEEEREFVIGYNDPQVKEQARVNYKNKFIFLNEEDEQEILFPELEHNAYVELEGHITRGNEKSNDLGFQYKNHVLTCFPEKGSIKDYRNAHYTNCIVKGVVDRSDKFGKISEKRPRIKFVSISISDNKGQLDLFS